MDYQILADELTNDPLGRGYAGMTDEQAAADLNTAYRQRNRQTMTGSEVVNAIDTAEFNALTTAQQDRVWNVLHLGDINPFGVEASLFVGAFGAGSDTITALAALRVESITRARELGIGEVKVGHVQWVRSL